MDVTLVKEIIQEAIEKNLYEKDICFNKNINLNTYRYFKTKYNLNSKKGKHQNSRKIRNFTLNDNYFSKVTPENSYWAGFIAADGNISKDNRQLTISLARKDKKHLENFIKDLNSNYKVHDTFSNGCPISSIYISSKKICLDLKNNFNITPAKSLTLEPPNITDINCIDKFIQGYIDGDGSIGLYSSSKIKQKSLRLSVLGTETMCLWIHKRFLEILNKTKLAKPKKDDNIFIVYTSDKNARELFQYFYNLPGRKLNRKWSKDIFDHCINYKKYENLEKYKQILNLDLQNKTKKEICSILNISLSLLYFYQNRETYIKMKNKKLNLESKQADKGVVDIEEEQSEEVV